MVRTLRKNRGSTRISASDASVLVAELRSVAPNHVARWLADAAPDVTNVLRTALDRPRRQPANPQCATSGPLYDSEGRRYRIDYRVLDTAEDGAGPLICSNKPGSFALDRAYPGDFQARDLSSPAESAKIRKIAGGLDPTRVLWAHSDPTLGAPVVWENNGRFYVLGGNGRTIGILMAPSDRYAAYLDELRTLWGSITPDSDPPAGTRYVLVRVVTKADGRALPLAEAVKLAGASQESTAGGETPLGRALSVVRGLGITDVSDLPAFEWSEPLTIDNIGDFQTRNSAFWRSLVERMDPARREAYGQAHKAVELVKQVCVGFLPVAVRAQGFGDDATEETLMSALPLMVSLETQVAKGFIKAPWSLLKVLPDAISLYRSLQNMPKSERPAKAQMHTLLEREAAQPSLGAGATTLLSGIHLLGFYLGVGLARWSGLRDPSVGVKEVLEPYYMAARSDAPGQGGMFGASFAADPVSTLAGLMNLRIPARLPPGVRRNPARGQTPTRAAILAHLRRGRR